MQMPRVFAPIFVIFLLFQTSSRAIGATYYADVSSGNDNSPGTQSQPWKNCPGMPGWSGPGTLTAGDIVYFDSGDTWTFSSSTILVITGGVTYIGDVWGTGTRARFLATGNLGASPGTMVAFGGDHPTYETIFQGFEVDGNNQSVSGVTFNRDPGPYTLLTGATKRVQNCLIHDQNSTNVYTYGIIVSHFLTPNPENYVTENVEILDNVVYNQGRTAINLYTSNTFDSCRIGNILVKGNETYNTAMAPDYDAGFGMVVKNHVENVIIEYNYFHGANGNTGGAAYIDADVQNSSGPKGIVYRYNILNNISNANLSIRMHGNKEFEIYGNLIFNSGSGQGILIQSNDDTITGKIYNNTLYNDRVVIENHSASGSLQFKNNIIYSPTGSVPLYDPNQALSGLHSNNVYFRPEGGTLVSSGGVNYTSLNLTNYEQTALNNEPLFTNPANTPSGFSGTYGFNFEPNTDGLKLIENSPLIDQGEPLGLFYNGSINSIPRPAGSGWDIGSYEHQDGSNQGNAKPSPPFNLAVTQM